MLKRKALFLGLMAVLMTGFALGSQAIPNWPAPATWSPSSSGGLHTMDLSNPLPFIPVTPCRVADTRGNGFVGAYGPPSLVANANRNFTITGQCGIPTTAQAVSFNFGALNVPGAGDLRIFPAGAALPLVSTLNYNANTPNIANAAIVPLGVGGAITVRADAVPVDLIIDVNGYYYDAENGGGVLTTGEQWLIIANVANGSGLYGENRSIADGSRGIRGYETGTTGTVYGVWGQTESTDTRASGVLGTDGADVANPAAGFSFSAGVIGRGRHGVIGVSSTPLGWGVLGVKTNTAGTITAVGRLGQDGGFGVYAGTGDIGCTSCPKSFIDPHPTDPTKEIRYVSLEGNEAGTYFRGTATTLNHEFVIEVPEDFRLVTDSEGLTVQLTPVGAGASMYVASEDLNQIVVRASKDVKFHYLVQGIRPAHKNFKAIRDTEVLVPASADARMPDAWPEWTKQRMIANGTYNQDGTVNMQTAERLGWAQMWRDEAENARANAQARRAREETAYPR